MVVKDIIDALEEFAPLGIQEKWDNSGLIIGSPSAQVHKVLIWWMKPWRTALT